MPAMAHFRNNAMSPAPPALVIEGGEVEPAEADHDVNENGALLPGPGAILTGPTFAEWLDSTP
jgi:hypothetical protein